MQYVRFPEKRRITEEDCTVLKTIERHVSALDPVLEPSDDEFRLAVLVISAVFITGPWVEPLVELTGYPPELVSLACNNMRAVGLWTDEVMYVPWVNEDDSYNAMLWTHVLVAEGLLTARQDSECGWIYMALPLQ